MSEYQYYEFQAIDRSLTADEMNELRKYSSRARITPTSFVVDYSWSDFKGNEDSWMKKYFDAFLYLANWGTHVLKLRLPFGLLDPEIVKQYCYSDSAFVREKAGKVILTFASDDEDGGDWGEGEEQLSSMIFVRTELAQGDLRALYLGWLLQAQMGELDDDDVEPPVPPGLGKLSASLDSLAEFLRIDSDLLHAAAEASAPLEELRLSRDKIHEWVGRLPIKEKDELITRLVMDGDRTPVAELLQRFLNARSTKVSDKSSPRRTVLMLRNAAELYAEERSRIEAEKRVAEKSRREREAATARKKHLDSLVGQESKQWDKVDRLIADKQAKSYDLAVKTLVDLRDLAARTQGGDFRMRIEALQQEHARKPAFIERLGKAGL